jgi:hypothetical protein
MLFVQLFFKGGSCIAFGHGGEKGPTNSQQLVVPVVPVGVDGMDVIP